MTAPAPILVAERIAAGEPFAAAALEWLRIGFRRFLRGASGLLVAPSTWKKSFALTRDKTMSRTVASRLYRWVALRRVMEHNLAEAILLARYAIQSTQGGSA
jgi:hypothetical protein